MCNKKTSIHFFYPKAAFLTGQEVASNLILQSLSHRWNIKPYHIPAVNRNEKFKIWVFIKYTFDILKLWTLIISLIFRRNIAIYLNFGQSWNSILRDGVPFICLKLFRRNIPLVISLHGHWFAKWPKASWKMRAFLRVLSIANIVVVLSEIQEQFLVQCGIKKESISVIANTCEIEAISDSQLKTKHLSDKVVKILFLSNLIDTKGYNEFLGMLGLLKDTNSSRQIEATLCGDIIQVGFSCEPAEATENIEDAISKLNENDNISVTWKKGAFGKEKLGLLRESHIFVFPSRIEAQPIVLLEALASGCAIISSKAGLIPSMLSEDAAVLLENLSHEEIAKQTVKLINNQHIRISLAQTALERYRTLFSNSIYEQNWNNLFIKLTE
ncbi:MAG: glycosyltransferase family 4 protein [Planctomycetes bacterium]|nr:glycosyltransferase family 4 protein [Planctomycetota bacterium]